MKKLLASLIAGILPFQALGTTILSPSIFKVADYKAETAYWGYTRTYDEVAEIPTFTYAQLRLFGANNYTTFCFNGDQCAYIGVDPESKLTVFAYTRDDVPALLKQTKMPVVFNTTMVKIDQQAASEIRRETDAKGYTYRFGDNDDVDEKLIINCGFGIALCEIMIFSSATGWGAIGAGVSCLATAVACGYAAKTMKKYEASVTANGAGGVDGPSGQPTTSDPGIAGDLDCKWVVITIDPNEKPQPVLNCVPKN